MITLNKSGLKHQNIISVIELAVGAVVAVMEILSILNGKGTSNFDLFVALFLVVISLYQLSTNSKVAKRYGTIFDEAKEITVKEISYEKGVPEAQVVKDLKRYVTKRQGRNKIDETSTINVEV